MKCETRNVFYKHRIKQNTHSTSSEMPYFYQMPVTEREIVAEHMGAPAFVKVYGCGFLLPSTFFLVVSLFHTLLPLWIEVVKGLVQQLKKYVTISTIPFVVSPYFWSKESSRTYTAHVWIQHYRSCIVTEQTVATGVNQTQHFTCSRIHWVANKAVQLEWEAVVLFKLFAPVAQPKTHQNIL